MYYCCTYSVAEHVCNIYAANVVLQHLSNNGLLQNLSLRVDLFASLIYSTLQHIYSTYTLLFCKCAVAAHVLLCTVNVPLLHIYCCITCSVLYCKCTFAAYILLQHMYCIIYAANMVLQHLCKNVLLQNMFW